MYFQSMQAPQNPIRSLVMTLVLLSLIALGITGIVLYVNGFLDPDKDGIPTYRDPQPNVYNGTVDADGDGWINNYERMIGTDLANPDQDEDGLLDGMDADGDGMSNWFERNVEDSFNPLVYNGRYYIQLMSIPSSTVNETNNREFWVGKERLEPEHYIVRYSVTLAQFKELIANLSVEVTQNDFVFLYLKTHGSTAKNANGEPILCFADEIYPDEPDRCGDVITYRELSTILDTLHPKYLTVMYSSCAGTDAVKILADGATPRVVIGVMGLNLGIPSEDLPTLSQVKGNNYFTLDDLLISIKENPADANPKERISDDHMIAQRYYFGEYLKEEYR